MYENKSNRDNLRRDISNAIVPIA